jgi:hypothetical protein
MKRETLCDWARCVAVVTALVGCVSEPDPVGSAMNSWLMASTQRRGSRRLFRPIASEAVRLTRGRSRPDVRSRRRCCLATDVPESTCTGNERSPACSMNCETVSRRTRRRAGKC